METSHTASLIAVESLSASTRLFRFETGGEHLPFARRDPSRTGELLISRARLQQKRLASLIAVGQVEQVGMCRAPLASRAGEVDL